MDLLDPRPPVARPVGRSRAVDPPATDPLGAPATTMEALAVSERIGVAAELDVELLALAHGIEASARRAPCPAVASFGGRRTPGIFGRDAGSACSGPPGPSKARAVATTCTSPGARRPCRGRTGTWTRASSRIRGEVLQELPLQLEASLVVEIRLADVRLCRRWRPPAPGFVHGTGIRHRLTRRG